MKLYGLNIYTGMAITARHFVETYVEDFKYWFGSKKRESAFRNQPDGMGSFTVQYPEEKLKVPERFRMLPVLIYEEDSGDCRCTACGICAKVCPPQCIWIVQAKSQEGKPKPKANDFFIDMDVCMNCGFCSEFCPFDAIKMDHIYELSNYERKNSHVYNMQDLLVSTEYYAQTHPRAWAKELAVKEEEEKKRKAKEAAAAAAAKKKAEEAAKAAAAAAGGGPAPAPGSTPDTSPTKPVTVAQKPEAPQPPAPKPAEAPAPVPPEAPTPAVPETPKPAAPETPTPAVPETPKPATPETPTPAVPETPKPATPETPTPEPKPVEPIAKKEEKPQ
jgi:NADH-quinone oxidoreductase subunit I